MTSILDISRTFSMYVGLFILIAGVFGSILQIIVFSSNSTYRKTPCTFCLLVAAVHDLGQLIISLGSHVVTSYLNVNINNSSPVWCKLRFFFGTSLGAISLSCICLSNIDQFFVTCRSVRFRQWSNMKLARRTSFCIIIIWWLHGSLWIFYRDIQPTSNCRCVFTDRTILLYSSVFVFLHLCALHTLIMTIFAFLCYRNIHRSKALIHRQYDRQMIIMVYMQTILAWIGLIPYGIVLAYIFIMKSLDADHVISQGELFATAVTYTLVFITYAVRILSLILNTLIIITT